MLNFLKLILLLTFSSGFAYAQDLSYARTIIDTLTSPALHGRGYFQKGDSLAAELIAAEFEKAGLKKIGNSYFQPFSIKVNTFPGRAEVKVDGKELKAGEDFIIVPSSGSAKNILKIERVDFNTFKEKNVKKLAEYGWQNIAFLFDMEIEKEEQNKLINKFKHELKPVVVIELTDDLGAWWVSGYSDNVVHLKIKREALPEKSKNIIVNVESELIENHTARNVVGFVEGTAYPDSFVVFSAHYDHLGRMGRDIFFPGANDNASGTAMLLDLAKYYSENPPEYSVVFIAFAAEEAGLLGSKYFTENPLFPLQNIKFLINMDILGTGDDGIMVVNGKVFESAYQKLVEINEEKNYLVAVKARGPARNSDHYYFYEKGIPSFFLYTLGGINAYHDIYDKPETLPLTEYEDIFRLITDFVKTL